MLQAITRQALKVDQKVATHNAALAPGQQQITIAHFFDHFANEDDISVTVTEDDFQSAHRDLVPSVSAEELGHYEKVRKAFEGNGTPSSKPTYQQPPPSQPQPQSQPQSQQIRPASQHSVGRPPTIRRTSSSNGSRNGQRSDKSTFYFDPAAASGEDEDEDEYVIRTDHLGSNGHSNGRPVGKGNGNGNGNVFGGASGGVKGGRGKGKATAAAAFGSATDGDEELYE
jgi:peroxin-6